MAESYEHLSKAELRELLEKRDKTSNRIALVLVLFYAAFCIFIMKDEIVTLLIKAGAQVSSGG